MIKQFFSSHNMTLDDLLKQKSFQKANRMNRSFVFDGREKNEEKVEGSKDSVLGQFDSASTAEHE